jgi:hypothetical protein
MTIGQTKSFADSVVTMQVMDMQEMFAAVLLPVVG